MNEEQTKYVFSVNLSRFMRINKMTQEDIAKITGVTQQSVSNWLNCKQIPRMGVIETLAGKFGVLKSDLLEAKSYKQMRAIGIRIPILGTVPCGVPIEAIEDIIDYEDISESLNKKGDHFGLKAKGDSMQPTIMDGDTLIVRLQESVESGQIAIVKVDGEEATCKKVLISEIGITLIPLNPAYSPVMFSAEQIQDLPVSIVGRVVEIRRSL